MEWINAELQAEHIVVRSLEEDLFDGLILHHLFRKLRPRPLLPRARRAPRLVFPRLAGLSARLSLLTRGPSHLRAAPQTLRRACCLWLLGTTGTRVPAPGCPGLPDGEVAQQLEAGCSCPSMEAPQGCALAPRPSPRPYPWPL